MLCKTRILNNNKVKLHGVTLYITVIGHDNLT